MNKDHSSGMDAIAKTATEPQSISKKGLEEVNDSIISLFECPVCYEYLLPPIYQCKNAHNICASCKSKINQCPTCRETFLNARSLFAEEIAERLFYPCKNADVGCTEKHTLSEIQEHHRVCPYRQYECLVGQCSNCPWKGRRFEIVGHVREGHISSAWMTSDNSIVYESDILQGIEDIQLVSALNEIFWYHLKYDVDKRKLFIALQYIGPKEEASSFKYAVHVTSPEDEEVGISFRNRAAADVTSVADIYQSGNCVVLGVDELKRFLESDHLFSFILKVEKPVLGI